MHVIALALMLLAGALSAGDNSQTPELRPPRQGGVYVVAHRGAHQGIPENTLAAYRKAIELGADFVEVDVRTTRDGALVSIHNESVDAYARDISGKVAAFTLEELRAMDIGSRVGPEWADERIPTLDEIFTLCKGKVGLYLDLKAADTNKVLEAVRAHAMENDVLWYAAPARLRIVQETCPKCWIMPDPGPGKLLPRILNSFRPRVVAAVWRFFSADFVKVCHDAGAIVIVDESGPDCWEQALEWRADGIQTDHPAELISFLKARAQTRG